MKKVFNAIFVTLFFVLLCVPAMHISKAEKSQQENRMLAKFPHSRINHHFNNKYGEEINAWFNDRFFGRDLLIKIYSDKKYKMSKIYANTKALYIKDTGWLFNFPIVPTLDDKTTAEIIENIKLLKKFCENNKSKLYVLLVPKKESIYQEYLRDTYGYDTEKDNQFQKQILKISENVPNNIIVYPYDELQTAKKEDFIFFKVAHHWTDWGAYNGYQALMNRIKQDFHNIEIATTKDYNISKNIQIRDDWSRNYLLTGHTINLLNIHKYSKDILTTEYTYYDNKRELNYKYGDYTKDYEVNKKGKYKILVMGDSQNEDLLQFLPYSAKQLKYIRLNKGKIPTSEQFKLMKHHKQEILDFKPDIVIFTRQVQNIHSIKDLFKD